MKKQIFGDYIYRKKNKNERKMKIRGKRKMSEKIIELQWKFVKSEYPYSGSYTFSKTDLMEKYEKETGKRSVYKIIKEPIGHHTVLKGKVQITEGFLKWKKNKQKNK